MRYLLAVLLLWSCSRDVGAYAPTPTSLPAAPLAPRVLRHLPYGSDTAQVLDLHLPLGRSASFTPLVVLIHGGDWTSGSKADMEPFVAHLRNRYSRFALAVINYRLAGRGNLLTAAESDLDAALQWLDSRRDQYQFGTRRVLIGADAGGHLALLYAARNTSPDLRGIITINAPSELSRMWNESPSSKARTALEAALGGSPTQRTDLYRQASPIYSVRKPFPTLLLIHGADDRIVLPQQGEDLLNAALSAGEGGRLEILPGESHVLSPTGLQVALGHINTFFNVNPFRG